MKRAIVWGAPLGPRARTARPLFLANRGCFRTAAAAFPYSRRTHNGWGSRKNQGGCSASPGNMKACNGVRMNRRPFTRAAQIRGTVARARRRPPCFCAPSPRECPYPGLVLPLPCPFCNMAQRAPTSPLQAIPTADPATEPAALRVLVVDTRSTSVSPSRPAWSPPATPSSPMRRSTGPSTRLRGMRST